MHKKLRLIAVFSLILLASCKPSSPINNEVFLEGKEVIKNVNARIALATAFDKNFINDELFFGTAKPANFLIPENFSYGPSESSFDGQDFRELSKEFLEHDIENSKMHWQLAKDELGFDTTSIEILVYDTDTAGKTAQFLEQEMETHLEGLDVVIRTLPYTEKQAAAEEGDFELHWTGWRPDFTDPTTLLDLFVTDRSFNETGWSNDDYDNLVNLATSFDLSVSGDERFQAMINAEQILLDEAVIIPLYQSSYYYLENPELKGWVAHKTNPGVSYQWITIPDNKIRLVETKNIKSLDSNAASDTTTNKVLGSVAEGLFKLSENDKPVYGSIESYTFNEETMTLSFKIKNGLMWVNHLGESVAPLTAYDFEYGWNRLIDPEQGNRYSFMLSNLALVENFKATDDYTFEVQVSKLVPYLDLLLSYPIFAPLNEAFVSETGDQYGTSVEMTLFNGPFYVEDWTIDLGQTLKRNDYYWESDDITLEEVSIRVVTDADNTALVNLYLNGEIDRVQLKGENIALYKERNDVTFFDSSLMAYITFNLK